MGRVYDPDPVLQSPVITNHVRPRQTRDYCWNTGVRVARYALHHRLSPRRSNGRATSHQARSPGSSNELVLRLFGAMEIYRAQGIDDRPVIRSASVHTHSIHNPQQIFFDLLVSCTRDEQIECQANVTVVLILSIRLVTDTDRIHTSRNTRRICFLTSRDRSFGITG